MESQEAEKEGGKNATHQNQQPEEKTPPCDGGPTQDKPADKPTDREVEERWWRDKRWRHPQVIVNGILAIIGVIAAAIYYGQLIQMKKATQAATNATSLATLNSHLDLRAWVAIAGGFGKPEVGKRWQVTVEAQNTGRTFGKEYRMVICSVIRDSTQAEPNFEGDTERAFKVIEKFGRGVIAPNEVMSGTVEPFSGATVTQQQIDYVKSPNVRVLLFGKIVYWDIFGCEHWTTFCAKVNPENGKCDGYGPYNDADNNCGPETSDGK